MNTQADHGHKALTHVTRREADAACEVLQHAAGLAAQEHYDMGLKRAAGIRHSFPPGWSRLRAVRDLDEQFRLLAG